MRSDFVPVAVRRPAADRLDKWISLLLAVGLGILRYGVAFLLVAIGVAKFFAFEAEGIKPLVASGPLLSWMLDVFGVRGTSDVIGCIEIAAGVAIATRRFAPMLSAIGSALGIVIFLTTLSFLFSLPGALSLKHPASAFLMKDIVLLGACVATAGEALRVAVELRRARRGG